MITPMRKYTFVLYHEDYEGFLNKLQKLGVVHVIRNKVIKTETLSQNLESIERYTETVKFINKTLAKDATANSTSLLPLMLLNQFDRARESKEALIRQRETLKRQITDLKPWGYFDPNIVESLKQNGIYTSFYTISKNHFKQEWIDRYALQVIAEGQGLIYFVKLGTTDVKEIVDADVFSFPAQGLLQLERALDEINEELQSIENFFQNNGKTALEMFSNEIHELTHAYEFEDALHQSDAEAEEHINVLGGWIPVDSESALKDFLNQENIIYFSADPTAEDNTPVQLKNGWFARLFEPIAKLFMLPSYNDLDLTPYFAPFFMLFFGFCNADIGYGLILVIFALLMRRKSKDATIKGFMSLIALFGISTMIMGWVMGSLFAYDMKTWSGVGDMILIRNTEQIFNFALILGVVQILFGILVNAAKQMRQSGFRHGIASIGTFLFLLGAVIMGSKVMGANPGALAVYAKYMVYAGLGMVFLFNSPGKNVFINLASGIWIMYNVVTGFFGDLLSYIRLFALGVSSAILGLVVNAMAAQFSSIPILGPVLFLVFMIFGHSLNLALGALSGFVHPLRLTFVEFYKNAGFAGPGPEYKPFGRTNTVK